MDIQKLISQVLSSLNADSSLVEKFKKDPMATVQSLLSNLNLETDTLQAIVSGVTSKLNLDDGIKEAKGIFSKIASLFGK